MFEAIYLYMYYIFYMRPVHRVCTTIYYNHKTKKARKNKMCKVNVSCLKRWRFSSLIIYK